MSFWENNEKIKFDDLIIWGLRPLAPLSLGRGVGGEVKTLKPAKRIKP
jgi:hypothetical protein